MQLQLSNPIFCPPSRVMLRGQSAVKEEFVYPFLTATEEVFKTETGLDIEKGEIKLMPPSYTSEEVNVMVGVVGDIHGTVLYGMTEETAKKIASNMLNKTLEHFDAIAGSAIRELANVITGIASIEIEKLGMASKLVPPVLVAGRGVKISTFNLERIHIPVKTEVGDFEISAVLINK